MTLWRRVAPTIVSVSLVSAFAGTVVTLFATATYAIWMFTSHVPALLQPMETLSARCAAEPAGFGTTLPSGDLVRTFDLHRLPEGDAGPDPKLLARLRAGDDSVARFVWFEDHAGILLFRRADSGPCSLMEVRWTIAPLARIGMLILASLIAILSAVGTGLLSAYFVVRPVILRVQRIWQAASHVGDEKGYLSAADPFGDELASVSRQLDGAHQRIRSVTQMLIDRNRSLENNLGDVAHDLKTPLSSVQLALENLAKEGGPAQESAQAGLEDCLYLAAMIDNLRVGSQLTDGMNPTADGARAEVGELVGQVVRRLRPLGRWRDIEVDRAEASGEVWVTCRPLALERVIDNLVNNAVLHGRPGGHVAVLLDSSEDRFRLTVLDDGPGVPPDEFPLLGRRRFRGAAAKRSSHGTGLGLSIVAEVCHRCGWTLSFEQGEPSGLRVVVSGPMVAPPSGSRTSATASFEGPLGASPIATCAPRRPTGSS